MRTDLKFQHFSNYQINILSSFTESGMYLHNLAKCGPNEQKIAENLLEMTGKKFDVVNENTDISKVENSIAYRASLFSSTSEIIITDFNSEILEDCYQHLKRELQQSLPADTREVFRKIIEICSYYFKNNGGDEFHKTWDKMTIDIDNGKYRLIPIEEYIKLGKGVCRHHAVLAAFFCKRLQEEQLLASGQIFFNSENICESNGILVKREGHAWLTFIPNESNEIWSLDTAHKCFFNLGNEDESAAFDSHYGVEVRNSIMRRHQSKENSQAGMLMSLDKNPLEMILDNTLLYRFCDIRLVENLESQYLEIQISDSKINNLLSTVFSACNMNPKATFLGLQINTTDDTYQRIAESHEEISQLIDNSLIMHVFKNWFNNSISFFSEDEQEMPMLTEYSMHVTPNHHAVFYNLDCRNGLESVNKLIDFLNMHGINALLRTSDKPNQRFGFFNNSEISYQLILINPEPRRVLELTDELLYSLRPETDQSNIGV